MDHAYSDNQAPSETLEQTRAGRGGVVDDRVVDGRLVDDGAVDSSGIIPFADEPSASDPINDGRARADQDGDTLASGDRCEIDILDGLLDDTLDDAAARGSVVDRELGLDEPTVPAREGQYLCPCCGSGATRVVRVRIVNHAGWAAVCAVCAASLLEKLPGTIVGGMVKPSRKRRIKAIRAGRSASKSGESGGPAARGFRGGAAEGYRRVG